MCGFAWLEDAPEDPLVTVGDVTSAYILPGGRERTNEQFILQRPAARVARSEGEGQPRRVNGAWKLDQQLPLRRAASREWVGFAAHQIVDCGLERKDACP